MKDIKTMRTNVQDQMDKVNELLQGNDEVAQAKAIADMLAKLEALNDAIRANDYESFAKAKKPIEAIVKKGWHLLDAIKTKKIKGTTDKVYYEYKAEDKVEYVSLSECANNGVAISGWKNGLNELYTIFGNGHKAALVDEVTANAKGETVEAKEAEAKKDEQPNPMSMTSITKVLQGVFDALEIACKARKVDIEFMKAASAKFGRGVSTLAAVSYKVREEALIRVLHTNFTKKVYVWEEAK